MEGVVRRTSLLTDGTGAAEGGLEDTEGEILSKSLPKEPPTWSRGLTVGTDDVLERETEAVAPVLVFFCQEKEGAEEFEGAEACMAALVGVVPGCGAPCLAAVLKDEAADRGESFSYVLPF